MQTPEGPGHSQPATQEAAHWSPAQLSALTGVPSSRPPRLCPGPVPESLSALSPPAQMGPHRLPSGLPAGQQTTVCLSWGAHGRGADPDTNHLTNSSVDLSWAVSCGRSHGRAGGREASLGRDLSRDTSHQHERDKNKLQPLLAAFLCFISRAPQVLPSASPPPGFSTPTGKSPGS